MIDLTQCVVGVDLGDRKSVACIYARGAIVSWFEFAMTPEGVRAAFEGKGFQRVALEAGAQSAWVTRLLQALGYTPVVANPRKLKAISANERKSDRNDALILAKLVWADVSLLYPIQHRSEERALALSVLRARDAVVTGRCRVINTIRSMAKALGHRLKKGTAEGFVKREAEVPAELVPAVGGLFVVLHTLNAQIAAYDLQLERLIESSFPEAKRPKQVRGVGPVTALAFVLTLEDPQRFPNGRTAAAFIGLAPRRDQSGTIDRQLRISKTGSNLLRRLLVQCAQYILGPLGRDCDLRRWGHGLAARGGKNGKKRAVVATARKLAVLMFRLWKSGDVWKPLHNAAPDQAVVGAAPVATDEAPAQHDSSNLRSDEERPEPAVADDCAVTPGRTARPSRGRDCSAADGLDPSMHRAASGPSKSADRSVGRGTTSTANAETKPKSPKKPIASKGPQARPRLAGKTRAETTTHASADGDRGGPSPGVGVAPTPGLGHASGTRSASGSHGGPRTKSPRPPTAPNGVGPQRPTRGDPDSIIPA
jgi:transposase